MARESDAARQAAYDLHRARGVETTYGRQLRKLARAISDMIHGVPTNDPADAIRLQSMLNQYATIITPWASSVGARMIAEVNTKNRKQWFNVSRQISKGLSDAVYNTPVGQTARSLQQEQVKLITSLPRQAGERVQRVAMKGFTEGRRAEELAKDILATGEVTKSRANLIARTETSKADTLFTMARAQNAGSEGYTWETSEDADVRPSHRKMQGKFVRWDSPPTLDGLTGHAGALPNCFTGGTLVSLRNGLRTLYRMPYDGDLVLLDLGEGITFEATPNHPILTDRGWVAAGLLKSGDNLIQALADVVNDHENQRHATFDEIFSALAASGESHPGFAFNFYGDVANGDVHVVGAKSLLLFGQQAASAKSVGDFALARPDRLVIGPADGVSFHVLEADAASLRHQGNATFDVGLRHPQEHGVGSVPNVGPMRFEDATDGHTGDAKRGGKGLLAIAGSVPTQHLCLGKLRAIGGAAAGPSVGFDPTSAEMLSERVRAAADSHSGLFLGETNVYQSRRLINVRRRYASTHVYTLESYNGWYSTTPAGIVTKNCRCIPFPVFPRKLPGE